MLNIKRFACNMLQENCYVVSDETGECAIVDCGAYYDEEKAAIAQYIKEENLTPRHLIATHGHVDHNFGNRFVKENYGLLPEIHSADAKMLEQLADQAMTFFSLPIESDDVVPVGKLLTGEDTITVGNHTFKVIETPGHTPGGVFFYCEEEGVAFSGDTLFRGSIGRTDFEGGSMFMLIQSLRMVCQLPDTTKVYPGHGPSTTIGHELATNPYLDR